MKKIGLTGSIAAGKSTVLAMLTDQDIPTFSSDDAVHALYSGEAAPAIEALFPGVVHDGTVDRAALSQRLVADPHLLKNLEDAVHPLVRAKMSAFFEEAARGGAALAVADVPLLFETGFDQGFDHIVVVTIDPAIQRKRALARPGMTVEKLDAILARQMPQAEKVTRAHYVIDTSGPLEATAAQIDEIVTAIRTGNDTENP